MTDLEKVVRHRDGLTKKDFHGLVIDAIGMYEDGVDLEEILYDVFGVEPDYFLDLLELIGN